MVRILSIVLAYTIATFISVTLWEICYYGGYIILGIYLYNKINSGLQFLIKGIDKYNR